MSKIMISLSATQASIKGLEKLLTKASAAYYNTGKFLKIDLSKWPNATRLLFDHNVRLNVNSLGLTNITDKLFDQMQEVLKKEAPSSKVLKAIGAPVVKSAPGGARLPKVKLKHFMGSLDKIKADSADTWLAKHPGPYVISNKMDGVSIQLNYDKGQAPRAYTRGDGRVGQDISKLVPHLKIPQKLSKSMDVRGEIIMSESAFKSKWSKEFENARNLASGVVNRKEVHPAVKDMDVVIYEVLSPRGVPSAQLKELKELGFHVVPHFTYANKLTAVGLSNTLTANKLKSKHMIDGLVVTQDKKVSLAEDTNPDHSVAFKQTLESDTRLAEVVEVIWTASRNNLLKPVLVLKELSDEAKKRLARK